MSGRAETNYARSERMALCALFDGIGPDEPTLCAGWRTRELAAHLVVRERRPVAAFTGGARARAELAELPFAELVDLVRHPPWWSLGGVAVDRAVNTVEFFVHHEDVRRARDGWQPRTLPRAHQAALWRWLRFPARLGLRRFPGTVLLEAPGYGRARLGRGGDRVRVVGAPGELALFVSGRREAARDVAVIGPDTLAERLVTTDLSW